MSNATFAAGPPPPDDPPPASESFAAMEEEALAVDPTVSLSDPIQSCKKPYLELTLLVDDEPAAGAPYSVTLPDGTTRTGTVDEQGFVHIDDVDLAADEIDVRTELVESEDENTPDSFRITVTAKGDAQQPPAEESGEEEEDFEEPEFFHPTFSGRIVALPGRDDGD